jgi:eukaryotic-like serine/threonine-protein kinase
MPRAESHLAAELKAGRHQDQDWTIKTFNSVLSGMAYAHSQRRILHRDLKPENILIVKGTPMISDFGLGKRIDANTAHLTQSHMAMGTTSYMAPEQFVDTARVGPPADIYALGKMLGEMLTGRRPLVGRPRIEDFPVEFGSFIDKCTQDEPGDRYANAADALAAFHLLISGGSRGTESQGPEDLIKEWEILPVGQDQGVVSGIAATLVAARADEELFWRAVPRLPVSLVEQLMKDHAPEFDLILRAYDSHIQGGLPFEYCDVVANFYRDVYRLASNEAHKRLILERLIPLGASHNRWHVGDVVAGLLEGIADSSEAEVAAQVVRDNPIRAVWYGEYVQNRKLAPPIRKAFDAVGPQPDDDIPF